LGAHSSKSVTVSADRRATGSGTENLEAWLAYQQGRALAGTRKLTDLDIAQQRFAEATRLDPSFALAYVARAEARAVRSIFSAIRHLAGCASAVFMSDAERLETSSGWRALSHSIRTRERRIRSARG